MKYTVEIREIHVSHREVDADTLREAVTKACDGNYNPDTELVEYSHTPDLPISVCLTNTAERITDDYTEESDATKDKVHV